MDISTHQGLSVPATAAAALDALCGGVHRGALQRCVVRVGERAEIDLRALSAELGEERASALGRYWLRARDLSAGTAVGTEVIVIERRVGVWKQDTGKNKQDLGPQLEALGRLGPRIADALDEALGPKEGEEHRFSVTTTAKVLPQELGGPLGPGELRRRFVITVRYAPWRDRKVRRLAQLEALSEEAWPVEGDLIEVWKP